MKINNMNKRKGISLIVLVITIIVIIILAAAVMLNIDNNNPIENAKKAKISHNESVYQEELELYAINEYSNRNSNFNKDALNVFDGEGLKKYITSMLDEDKDKYIIWQGQLVKKDGDVYKYTNGEKATLLDGTPLTDNMIEFTKIIQGTDLLYNGGYITNVDLNVTVAEIKEKIGEDVIFKTYSGSSKTDTNKLATDDQIWYNGTLVARIIIFGDGNRSGSINNSDVSVINLIESGRKNELTIGQIISMDTDHNGVVDRRDYSLIEIFMSNYNNKINQNVYATLPSNV